eukprot:2165237-Rhodomonas_salina.2
MKKEKRQRKGRKTEEESHRKVKGEGGSGRAAVGPVVEEEEFGERRVGLSHSQPSGCQVMFLCEEAVHCKELGRGAWGWG